MIHSLAFRKGGKERQQLLEQLAGVAASDAEILILGLKHVGKLGYAEYGHRLSRRSGAAFVSVDCAAIPDHLLELKLFGREGGYRANEPSIGVVAAAEGGTLFLDGLEMLSPPSQMKLLRFIEDREYRCLGGTHLRRADIRIMAAGGLELLDTDNHEIREDLILRLRMFAIPPPAKSAGHRFELVIILKWITRLWLWVRDITRYRLKA